MHIGGGNTLRAARVTPPNIQKYPFVVPLKIPPCPFQFGSTSVSGGGPIYRQQAYLFFFSLSSPENYSFVLFVDGISTSILILLISNFCSQPFCINFICFQFHYSISIYQILYFLIWSLFFLFQNFFSLIFYKSFIGFQFYSSIQIDGVIFFNSALIILISNLFFLAFL